MSQSSKAKPATTLFDQVKFVTGRTTELYNILKTLEGPLIGSRPIIGTAPRSFKVTGLLKTAGDTMIGPYAEFLKLVNLTSSKSLDVSEATGTGFSTRIVLANSGGFDLETIEGAKHEGQHLEIQGVLTQTIKIIHNPGGLGTTIRTNTKADVTLTGNEIAQFRFDGIAVEWILIAISQAGGSTSFIGFTADADLKMGTFDVKGVDRLLFDIDSQDFAASGDTGFVRSTVGLHYNIASLKAHILRINNLDQFVFTNLAGVGADYQGNLISDLFGVDFQVTGHGILSDTTAMSFTLPQFDIYRYLINSVLEFTVEPNAIDFQGNDQLDVDDIFFSSGHSIRNTTGGLEIRLGTGDDLEIFRGGIFEYELGVVFNLKGNNMIEVASIFSEIAGSNISFSTGETLYQVASGKKHAFYVAAVKYVEVLVQELKLFNNAIIAFDGNRISLSASAGFATAVPALPVAYIDIKVGGASYKMPYYSP